MASKPIAFPKFFLVKCMNMLTLKKPTATSNCKRNSNA